MRALVFIVFCMAACGAIAATPDRSCKPGAKWTEPAAPLKIYGNTWFVGTCGISSILVTSPQGHVLIDAGVTEAAPLVEANIRRLGFRVEDVRFIVNSHEHYDHAGGIAQLQRDSHATVAARTAAAAALERGKGDRSDPQFLIADAFPSVTDVRRIGDGDTIRIGPIELTAHATPAHTPGSTSWTWTSCEHGRCLHLAYADSFSAISDDVYRYSDEAAHPGVAAAFRRSIEAIAALPCDILLTPHPDASDLWLRLGPGATAPLVDADACRRYAAGSLRGFEKRLEKERNP